MPGYQKTLLIAIFVLLIFIAVSSIYIFKLNNTCSIKIISEEGMPKVTIADNKLWGSFIDLFTTCDNGNYQVYDQKHQPYKVSNISYIIRNDDINLISFMNVSTQKTYFKWRNGVNLSDDSAVINIYIPEVNSEDFGTRLFSAIFMTTKTLFRENTEEVLSSDAMNVKSLEMAGLTYEK